MPKLPDFTFSPTALAQLRRVRQQYLSQSPDDPPAMLGIFWGWPISTRGKQTGGGAPIVGYWRKSEFTDAAWSEVSKVDGMDLIFSVRPIDRHQFEGKVIDYSPERTFFLRDAATGPAKR
jgi:hypothetical protein